LVWALLRPLLSTPVLAFLFWVCLALLWHIYITIILFYLVLSPPAFMPQPLGLFRLLSLALLRPCVIPLPAASGSGPAAAPLDNNNIGPSTTGLGPIAAPVFNIHVLAPGNREPPPRTAVPAPVSGTAARPAFPDISIPIPEVVEESSCLSPGPQSNGPVDPELQIWPLCLAPDWPILDSWRDFAFSTITLRPSSDSPGESSSDSKGR